MARHHGTIVIAKTTASTALALLSALSLAACGDGGSGGVSSTPTPSPTPSPSPSPTQINTSLLSPLSSESFRNVASLATISAPISGASVLTSAASTSATISYNSANQSYTVTEGSRSQTFSQSNVDSSQSSGSLTTYKVTSGNTTDQLSLTTTGTGTGQSRYVAGALWQRQVNGSSSVDGRYTAVVYGIQTADAALPRTGSASYDVTLLGARTFSTQISALSGAGTVNADFATGGIYASGFYDQIDSATGVRANGFGWRGSALISTANNSFNGTLTLDSVGNGELHGALFGPAAEEIGGSFSVNPTPDVTSSGVLFGPRGSNVLNQQGNLNVPRSDAFYKPVATDIKATVGAAGKLASISSGAPIVSVYQGKDGSPFLLFNGDGRITAPFPGGGYEVFGTNLNYMRAGTQFDNRNSAIRFDAFAYGFDTASSAVPRTGSASYDVLLRGAVAAPGSNTLGLTGNGSISVDFSSGAIASRGAYSVISNVPGSGSFGGTASDTGSWSGNGTLSSSANAFSGSITLTAGATYNGTLSGKLFGPGAEEIGASFQASSAIGGMASGVLYGQRGQDTTVSQNGLLGLTRTTTMHSGAAMYSITPSLSVEQFINNDPSVDVTYDPANKSYVLQSTSSGVNLVVDALSQTLKQSDKDPVKSDASFTVYHSGATDARILNPGSDNPAIALTYTSFAEVTKPTTYGTYPSTTTYYVPFGGETLSYQMPLSGKATYSGVVYGQGWDGVTASESKVSGASKFSVDFGTGAANMVLSLNATSNSTNATRSVGEFNYLGGGCNGPCGSNQIGLGDNDPGLFNSLVTGKFFGPNAAEFGATFFLNISATDGHAEHQSSFTGVTVGKKDP